MNPIDSIGGCATFVLAYPGTGEWMPLGISTLKRRQLNSAVHSVLFDLGFTRKSRCPPEKARKSGLKLDAGFRPALGTRADNTFGVRLTPMRCSNHCPSPLHAHP